MGMRRGFFGRRIVDLEPKLNIVKGNDIVIAQRYFADQLGAIEVSAIAAALIAHIKRAVAVLDHRMLTSDTGPLQDNVSRGVPIAARSATDVNGGKIQPIAQPAAGAADILKIGVRHRRRGPKRRGGGRRRLRRLPRRRRNRRLLGPLAQQPRHIEANNDHHHGDQRAHRQQPMAVAGHRLGRRRRRADPQRRSNRKPCPITSIQRHSRTFDHALLT